MARATGALTIGELICLYRLFPTRGLDSRELGEKVKRAGREEGRQNLSSLRHGEFCKCVDR